MGGGSGGSAGRRQGRSKPFRIPAVLVQHFLPCACAIKCRRAALERRVPGPRPTAPKQATHSPPPPTMRHATPGEHNGERKSERRCSPSLPASLPNPTLSSGGAAKWWCHQLVSRHPVVHQRPVPPILALCRDGQAAVHNDVDPRAYYLNRLERAAPLPASEEVGGRERWAGFWLHTAAFFATVSNTV